MVESSLFKTGYGFCCWLAVVTASDFFRAGLDSSLFSALARWWSSAPLMGVIESAAPVGVFWGP